MNDDYKKVDHVKYRNVLMKEDIATLSYGVLDLGKLELKLNQPGLVGMLNWNLGFVNLGTWLVGNDTFGVKSLIQNEATAKPGPVRAPRTSAPFGAWVSRTTKAGRVSNGATQSR
jgi:hypothetical protein